MEFARFISLIKYSVICGTNIYPVHERKLNKAYKQIRVLASTIHTSSLTLWLARNKKLFPLFFRTLGLNIILC